MKQNDYLINFTVSCLIAVYSGCVILSPVLITLSAVKYLFN